jgi:nucleotide-binding universal stress UspA family protein
MTEQSSAQDRIVVGVDGSAPSVEALRWAVRQAELTHAAVEAVIAWEYPQFYGYGWAPDNEEFDPEAIARTTLAETIGKAFDGAPPVEIGQRVGQGGAAKTLIDASEGASLLVVGNRGHGGFAGALLGSVAQHCISHATCPTVVIRGTGH